VIIELSPIRMIQRRTIGDIHEYRNNYRGYFRSHQGIIADKPNVSASYSFLPETIPKQTDVIFFAGCMTHLTPAIKKSMIKILNASGVNYNFIDEEGGVCCGRPLMLAGQDKEARDLINCNSQMIWKSGAHTLVTSCPICYKVFKESYYLDAEVLHHTQFIKNLIDDGNIKLRFLRNRVVYHTPCDLGRGSGVYDEPKEVLRHVVRLEKNEFEDENSLCCGGSLANMRISSQEKKLIASYAAGELTKRDPDILATSCPLCKKTFIGVTETRVADISEIVAEALIDGPVKQRKYSRQIHSIKELANIS